MEFQHVLWRNDDEGYSSSLFQFPGWKWWYWRFVSLKLAVVFFFEGFWVSKDSLGWDFVHKSKEQRERKCTMFCRVMWALIRSSLMVIYLVGQFLLKVCVRYIMKGVNESNAKLVERGNRQRARNILQYEAGFSLYKANCKQPKYCDRFTRWLSSFISHQIQCNMVCMGHLLLFESLSLCMSRYICLVFVFG